MASDNATAWDHYSPAYQTNARLTTDAAHYGPDIPTESELRLLGDLRGKRVLDLGCGGGQTSVVFAKAGATVVGVDASAQQLAHARRLCDAEEVRVDFRQGDMADLAFLRADTIDVAFSSGAFHFVEDLSRVFRQVHRVLKVGAPLVFSVAHPAYALLDDETSPPRLARSYFDGGPRRLELDGAVFTTWNHTFSSLYMGLVRASYRVDVVLEPEPVPGAARSWFWREAMDWVPRTLVVRARKEGS